MQLRKTDEYRRGEISGAARAVLIAYDALKQSMDSLEIDSFNTLLDAHIEEMYRLINNAHQLHSATRGDPIALAWSLLYMAGNDLAAL